MQLEGSLLDNDRRGDLPGVDCLGRKYGDVAVIVGDLEATSDHTILIPCDDE